MYRRRKPTPHRPEFSLHSLHPLLFHPLSSSLLFIFTSPPVPFIFSSTPPLPPPSSSSSSSSSCSSISPYPPRQPPLVSLPRQTRDRESSPRHIRSMAMIGASESQERKLHGCAHRQQISYFQKPLIAASHLDFWSSDKFHWCRLKRRGWLATWWHLSLSPVLSSALCEQYPLNKPFTPLLSWLLWSVKRSQQAVELPR